MILEHADKSEVESYKRTKMQILLDEFINSGEQLVEVVNWESEYAQVATVASTINAAAKRFGYANIHAFISHKRAYIQRMEE